MMISMVIVEIFIPIVLVIGYIIKEVAIQVIANYITKRFFK